MKLTKTIALMVELPPKAFPACIVITRELKFSWGTVIYCQSKVVREIPIPTNPGMNTFW